MLIALLLIALSFAFLFHLIRRSYMKKRTFVPPEIEVKTHWSELLHSRELSSDAKNFPVPGVEDIFAVNEIFSAEECEALISAAESHGFGETDYPKEYRGNLRLITFDKSLSDSVWSRLQSFVPSTVNESGRKYKVVGLNECWRLAKYFPGDQFGSHVDAFFEDHKTGQKSMFTVNIYMNGGFKGGNTTFYTQGKTSGPISSYDIVPEAGLAVLFRQPPAKSYLHKGQVLQSGNKYLFRSDVMYTLAD